MKKWITVLALGASMALAGLASAKDKAADGSKPVHGKVTAVSPDSADKNITDVTVTVGGKKNPHDVVLKVDKDTKVTKDGQAATASDIATGENVVVSQNADGKATSVEISTKHKEKAAAK